MKNATSQAEVNELRESSQEWSLITYASTNRLMLLLEQLEKKKIYMQKYW